VLRIVRRRWGIKKENLAYIIDLILNHAKPDELSMIQRALDKRQSGVSKIGSPQAMAKNMAQTH
jgi:hypothetical protein